MTVEHVAAGGAQCSTALMLQALPTACCVHAGMDVDAEQQPAEPREAAPPDAAPQGAGPGIVAIPAANELVAALTAAANAAMQSGAAGASPGGGPSAGSGGGGAGAAEGASGRPAGGGSGGAPNAGAGDTPAAAPGSPAVASAAPAAAPAAALPAAAPPAASGAGTVTIEAHQGGLDGPAFVLTVPVSAGFGGAALAGLGAMPQLQPPPHVHQPPASLHIAPQPAGSPVGRAGSGSFDAAVAAAGEPAACGASHSS